MARRKITRQQCEILLSFIEDNKHLAKGLPVGSGSQTEEYRAARYQWAAISKQLNTVNEGVSRNPDSWRRYWFGWRHKTRKKAAALQRRPKNRLASLDDLEIRILGLDSSTSSTKNINTHNMIKNIQEENTESDLELNSPVKDHPSLFTSNISPKNHGVSKVDNLDGKSPPPQWALDLEERRIAAEERMAKALETIAKLIRQQEVRQSTLEERATDALMTLAGTVQELNTGVQEAVHHLQRLLPVPPDEQNNVERHFLSE